MPSKSEGYIKGYLQEEAYRVNKHMALEFCIVEEPLAAAFEGADELSIGLTVSIIESRSVRVLALGLKAIAAI